MADMSQVGRDLNTRMGHPTADGTVKVVIVEVADVTRPTVAELNPCTVGMHMWAYLTVGGQECYRCGLRRR